MSILQLRLVKDATLATSIEIGTYIAALGFAKLNNEERYANVYFEVGFDAKDSRPSLTSNPTSKFAYTAS